MSAPLAHVVRGELVESIHRGHLVSLDKNGIDRALGNVNLPIYPRSAIKPIQAAAMVELGLDLPDRLLALAAASHSGGQVHRAGAKEILSSVGLDVQALQCPPDYPYGSAERAEWANNPKERIAHNCSGKHSAMLATCIGNDWPIANYRDPFHPLQQKIAELLEELSEEKIVATTVDGCGAPLFAISTLGLARAIAKVASGERPSLARVAQAMRAHPEMVAGEGRSTTQFMRAVPGLIVKEGAEGVEVFALPDGRACAIKIEDGSMRALPVLVGSMLISWGVATDQTKQIASVPILGGGEPMGSIVSLVE